MTFVRAVPSDLTTIESMFRRCSVQSRLGRFFRPLPSAPHGYLEEVLAGQDRRHAFAVRCYGETIGLAELHLTGPWSGDLALIIEDPYQRQGLGTAALRLLVRRARDLGLRTLTADVLVENAALLDVLRLVGPGSVSCSDDVFHVELDLEPAEHSEAAAGEGTVCLFGDWSHQPMETCRHDAGRAARITPTGAALTHQGPSSARWEEWRSR